MLLQKMYRKGQNFSLILTAIIFQDFLTEGTPVLSLISCIQISESPTVAWFSIVEKDGCLVTSINQNILAEPSGFLYKLLL
jgi:hypothetical protein